MNEKSKKVKEAKINKKSHITLQTSQNKGITLVALIITIIVLLILAVVAIRAVQGDGIISHAKNARADYEKAQLKEETKLSEYEQYIASLGERTLEEITIENAQSVDMLERKQNTQTQDKYGNKIVVPAGFKILVDETTDYKEDTIDVTKGIVIQDASGNEFVWVPVGKIKYEEEDTIKTTTIELKRYVFYNNGTINESLTQTEPGGRLGDSYDYYTEDLKDSKTTNAHAKDIVAFKTSAIKNHGYYIGRYEAGDSSVSEARTGSNGTSTPGTLVCKANQYVYNWITQPDASEKCQSMYINKPYESDLVNSYAWDTATVFIQTFGANGVGGKEPDSSTYSKEHKSTSLANTGINPDKYRNIYDMSGNCCEWTTETHTSFYNGSRDPCALRIGYYDTYFSMSVNNTSYRSYNDTTNVSSIYSFRPILYM